jgi:uncharacterized DUF497 family protein
MSWDNPVWARNHIYKKHPDVSIEEAWEVVFLGNARVLVAPDQLHFPPFRRYWTIGVTVGGKMLLVVWEQWKETKNLITAYTPTQTQVRIYEEQIKKSR